MSATRLVREVPTPGAAVPKVSLREVRKSFDSARGGTVAALDAITFDVAPGEFTCVIGPTGCGKSTLLNLVAGLERPDGGEVAVDGRRVTEPGPDRVVLFQEPALFPWLSVRGNVEFALKRQGIPRDERVRRTTEALRDVHLARFTDAQPHELSGGMRQRAALARALACRPQVLLADEPFGSLDAQSREMLQRQVQDVWRDTNTTFLFVTHNVREAVFLADRVLVMSTRPGRLLSEYRITAPRPRKLEDPMLSNVVVDIHASLVKEVERALVDEASARPDLA
jgi:NitT/TauT family transport system ATP-binding protein